MRVLAALLINALFNFLIGLIVARFLGPEEFGRFAVAVSLGLTVQVALFDWIRLAALRFYSGETRQDAPEVRATLDVGYVAAVLILIVGASVVLGLGPAFALSPSLIVLALVATLVNGLFDYSTGLLRASFQDRLYARLVIIKNALALCLTAGGALVFHSAAMALVGSALSLGGAVVLIRSALTDAGSTVRLASEPLARRYLAYAAPIVTANLFYLVIPFVNRVIVTKLFGFAETGQFSLAWDFGMRALQAIGSALDAVLFQIAVAAHTRDGVARAREQVARNLGLIIAAMLPTAIGLWLILPSIEQLIVPAEFRGPFERYVTMLLPGLFALSIASYGINPAFQIEKRTAPLILAAGIGCAGTPLFMLLVPAGNDASGLALAQSCAYVAALALLIVLAVAKAGLRAPPWRDLLAASLGCALLTASGLPLRRLEPGIFTLILQVLCGAATYGVVALAFDLGAYRADLLARLKIALRNRSVDGPFRKRKT